MLFPRQDTSDGDDYKDPSYHAIYISRATPPTELHLSSKTTLKMSSDLFPGFSSQHITTTSGARIFVRTSLPNKAKPPILLLHGFPQTHIEWHKLTPLLTPHFTVVLLDLRGYGASSSIPDSVNGSGYTKRLMGQDCVSVMEQLGFKKFTVVGHDRGARVAYRLAFDSPERLEKVVVLDVIPTATMFQGFGNVQAGLKAYHWLFLAQPYPFPETMISGNEGGRIYLEHTLASWTAVKSLESFDAVAMEKYREAYCNEEKIHTTCEDYRAAAFFDKVYDEEELEKGRKIEVPVLAVWGERGLFAEQMEGKKDGPLDVWRRYCKSVQGKGLACGHFIPEEDPEALAREILQFLL